jgi:hypothetical protein
LSDESGAASRAQAGPDVTSGGTRTDPRATDSRLWGRTYAIPFARVWDAAKGLADRGLRGWSLVRDDDREGVIEAVSLTWLRRKSDHVTVTIRLDENAQTRVDVRCVRPEGAPARRRHPRLINGFLGALDRKLEATPGQKLDPTAIPAWQRENGP